MWVRGSFLFRGQNTKRNLAERDCARKTESQDVEFLANSSFKPFGKLVYEGSTDDRFRR